MPTSAHRLSRFRAPAVLFWVALGLRLACILIGRTYRIHPNDNHWEFGYEAGRIAQSLYLGHGYGSPFNGPSGPTAWLPPLFPLLVALSFKVCGLYTNAAALFVLSVNSVFSAAIAPAVYEIAARCFDATGLARRKSTHSDPVALWSGWLWVAYPAALQFAIHWLWEMSLSTCLFSWTFVLALRLRRVGEGAADEAATNRRRDLGLWCGFGVLWGLVALANASLLLCLPATMLWILWPRLRGLSVSGVGGFRSPGLAPAIAGAALASTLFAATMTPWVVRNERAFHAFLPTRSNLGIELWQSSLFWHDAFPWGSAVPLWAGDPEFKLFVQMGEVPYARMRQKQAVANLRARPDLFLRYTRDRLQFFWFGTPHPTERHPINEFGRILNFSFTSLAGLMGMGLALRRRVPAAWLLAFPFLLVPIAYYVVTVQARFRHPIEPFITILAVYLFRSTTPLQKPALGAATS